MADDGPGDSRLTAIRVARADEMTALQGIERTAGRCFADIGMADVADEPPLPVDLLLSYQQAGRAWVAVNADDRPIAYLIAAVVDGNAHIDQVSVHPSFAGRRVGRSLIDHVAGRARAQRLDAVTLTTFLDVPWNGPYYLRCGFRVVPDEAMGPGLAALWAEEQARWSGRHPRVAMFRPAGPR
jgi:GNAT superfamily N-acetyltransferase